MPIRPVAIIDIGSNSVRLVVYSGATRAPAVVFNEKVMAGLGRDGAYGAPLTVDAQERALAALRRFRILVRQMGVKRTRVVATAAVRDASNCEEFMQAVRAIGFDGEILSGDEEAVMAGQGVLSAIPDADGVVGDLGGGSLELVDVAGHEVHEHASLPLGVLRIDQVLEKGEGAVARKVAKAVEASGFHNLARKRPFYMVGGSWRALARLDMHLTGYPLPLTHYYRMPPERPAALHKEIEALMRGELKLPGSLSMSRRWALPHANLVLRALVDELRPSELVVSAYGIREGLLYDDLSPTRRRKDPLIESVREAGRALGRFAAHGDLLDNWIAPVFADDDKEAARLRLAACLLADVAWQAHPDYRAERGVDIALHGNWVGIDGPGRVMVAQALFANFGGSGDFSKNGVARLCTPAQLERAAHWGLAMRLGQRLSGGVAAGLERSRLELADDTLTLALRSADEALYGEAVRRRLKLLATALRRSPEIAIV